MNNEPIIVVDQLVKQFDKIIAVNNISFDVEDGEIFGFLGPNGAGKTTTINIICTLLRPSSGRVVLGGFDVSKSPDRVRRSIGVVFQDASLDERLTAQENLEFHAMIYDVPSSLARSRIDQMLDLVELSGRRHDAVKLFSGGMKRRLEIARGLLHYPKVLFLDEPTLGLDPQTRSYIWQHILALQKSEGITIFMTTHYMEEAENCNRLAIIDHGQIVALDSPKALKGKVGGDVVRINTAEHDEAAAEVGKILGLDVEMEEHGIRFEANDASVVIPRLLKNMASDVSSISVHQPTLDDVFLKMTGRALRDEELNAAGRFKARARRHHMGRRK